MNQWYIFGGLSIGFGVFDFVDKYIFGADGPPLAFIYTTIGLLCFEVGKGK